MLTKICDVQTEKPTLRIGVGEFVQTLNGCYQYWQNLKKKRMQRQKFLILQWNILKATLWQKD